MVMFGGVNINPQTKRLRERLDILVATPGRLLDHAGQGNIDLGGIEILCSMKRTVCSTWALFVTYAVITDCP